MNITVTVDEVTLESVVGQYYGGFDRDGDPLAGQPQHLSDALTEAVLREVVKDDRWNGLTSRVLAIRDEEIRAALGPIITAAVLAPVQKTDTFGQPVGPATTLRELILSAANKVLTGPVDQYNRSGETLLGKIVREEVERTLAAEVRTAIAEERTKVVAAVRAKASELISKAVAEGVGVR